MSSITLVDVAVSHGVHEIFSGVSLTVGAGSRVGLVGPNGSARRRCSGCSPGSRSPSRRVRRARRSLGRLPAAGTPSGGALRRPGGQGAARRAPPRDHDLDCLDEPTNDLDFDGPRPARALRQRRTRQPGRRLARPRVPRSHGHADRRAREGRTRARVRRAAGASTRSRATGARRRQDRTLRGYAGPARRARGADPPAAGPSARAAGKLGKQTAAPTGVATPGAEHEGAAGRARARARRRRREAVRAVGARAGARAGEPRRRHRRRARAARSSSAAIPARARRPRARPRRPARRHRAERKRQVDAARRASGSSRFRRRRASSARSRVRRARAGARPLRRSTSRSLEAFGGPAA